MSDKFVFPIEIFLEPERFIGLNHQQRRDAVEQFVVEHPEKHNQGDYLLVPGREFQPPNSEFSCGTKACIAGWATVFAGYYPSEADLRYRFMNSPVCITRGDERLYISDLAQEILGLNDVQASALFYGGNSMETVSEIFQGLRDGWNGDESFAEWVREQRDILEEEEAAENRHP